jgi:hypothetical protein
VLAIVSIVTISTLSLVNEASAGTISSGWARKLITVLGLRLAIETLRASDLGVTINTWAVFTLRAIFTLRLSRVWLIKTSLTKQLTVSPLWTVITDRAGLSLGTCGSFVTEVTGLAKWSEARVHG